MKKDGIGGANTKTGVSFEIKMDLPTFISKQKNYMVVGNDYDHLKTKDKLRKKQFRWKVFYKNEEVAEIFQKEGLYRYLDEIEGYDYRKIISSKLLPDDSIFVIARNTVYIIEKKTQSVNGSTDEKLQTCDFKKKQYIKLFSPLNKEVEYAYLLDKKWFDKKKYKDVFDYIISVGCKYYFNFIPFEILGLPVPEVEND